MGQRRWDAYAGDPALSRYAARYSEGGWGSPAYWGPPADMSSPLSALLLADAARLRSIARALRGMDAARAAAACASGPALPAARAQVEVRAMGVRIAMLSLMPETWGRLREAGVTAAVERVRGAAAAGGPVDGGLDGAARAADDLASALVGEAAGAAAAEAASL